MPTTKKRVRTACCNRHLTIDKTILHKPFMYSRERYKCPNAISSKVMIGECFCINGDHKFPSIRKERVQYFNENGIEY